jgi:hypothetical protein
MPSDLSDSSVHAAAEPICLALVGSELNARLVPAEIRLDDGTEFHIDGVDRDKRVLCEVFAHVGTMKDGQKKKLAKDLLKLLAVEHSLGGSWRKVICVVDEPARDFLCGRSWCAGVVREFHFEVVMASLAPDVRSGILQAQVHNAEGMRR